MSKKKSRQKKYNSKVGDYEGVSGVTEYESNALPTPYPGIKVLEPGFETIWDYDKLYPLVKKARKDFAKDLRLKIDQKDILKINSGLNAYVKSSTKFSYDLDLLKASILNAEGEDILVRQYQISDEEVRQMIRKDFFEDLSELKVDACWLIQAKSILNYRRLAVSYTEKVIQEFIKLTDGSETDFASFHVYRGQGNVYYYNDNEPNDKIFVDTISTYTGTKTPFEYFERQLLNSYSINWTLAENFMVKNGNTRRLMFEAELLSVLPNLFSSFIVSDSFVDDQYELLCLPSIQQLFIRELVNDERSAEFHISDDSNPTPRLTRLTIPDEIDD